MKKYLVKVSLDHFAFGLTIPISVVWQLSRGINLGQVGIVTAIMTIAMVLTDIPTGIFADKFGRKCSLILSSLMLSLSTGIFFLSKTFVEFIIYAVVAAIGWSLLSGAEEAYVYETSLADKTIYRRAISNVSIIDESFTVLGLVFSSLLVKLFSMKTTIAISASLLLASFLLAFLLLREPSQKKSVNPKALHIVTDLNKFIRSNKALAVLMLVFAIYYEGGRLIWQPQLVNNGLKIASLGLVFAFFKLFSVAGSFAIKHREPTNFKLELTTAGIILAISFGLSSINSLLVIVIGLSIYSFIENYTRVLQSDYLNKVVKTNRATFLSLNNIVRNVYSAALMPLLGYLALKHVSKGFLLLLGLQLMSVLLFVSCYPWLKIKATKQT